jgi:hypothetical protein
MSEFAYPNTGVELVAGKKIKGLKGTPKRVRQMMKPGPVTIIKVEPGAMLTEVKPFEPEPMSWPAALAAPAIHRATVPSYEGEGYQPTYADAVNAMVPA